MIGVIDSLWRHPVKGFTPERLAQATLSPGGFFPCDRIFAVEDGPSGFDPDAPAWISKQKSAPELRAAVSAFATKDVEPASGEALSAHLANGGTALGGLCFLLGSLLLMPEAARAVASQQRSTVAPAAGTPAA